MTAVAPVVIKYNGAWVGWTGLEDFDVSRRSENTSTSREMLKDFDVSRGPGLLRLRGSWGFRGCGTLGRVQRRFTENDRCRPSRFYKPRRGGADPAGPAGDHRDLPRPGHAKVFGGRGRGGCSGDESLGRPRLSSSCKPNPFLPFGSCR